MRMPQISWDAGKGLLSIDYEDPELFKAPPAGPRVLQLEDFASHQAPQGSLPGEAPIPDLLSPVNIPMQTESLRGTSSFAAGGDGSTALNEHIDYGKTIAGGNMSNENSAE